MVEEGNAMPEGDEESWPAQDRARQLPDGKSRAVKYVKKALEKEPAEAEDPAALKKTEEPEQAKETVEPASVAVDNEDNGDDV